MSVYEERNLEGEGNNVVPSGLTGRKKRVVRTKSGERVGRIKFSNCAAWEHCALWVPPRARSLN